MVAAFEIGDVNPNPARFDMKKAEAINAAHMRLLSVEEIGRRSVPYLAAAGLVADPPTAEQQSVLDAAMPLVAERINKLTESVEMLGFLLVDEADFAAGRRDRRRRAAASSRRRTTRSPGSRTGRRPRSRTRCASRSSRAWGSSRATPSVPCASP